MADKNWIDIAINLVLAYKLFVLLKAIYDSGVFWRRGNLAARLKSYGEWCVITGCTSGTGRDYAEQIAALGLNLVLLARRGDALIDLARGLEERYGIQTRTFTVDLATDPDTYCDEFANLVSDLDIGILLNNAGVMYDSLQRYDCVPEKKITEILRVNCFATAILTRIVLPAMVTKKKGLIVFMGSGGCLYPMPGMTFYLATKAHIEYLAKTLALEFSGTGVKFQCLNPCYMMTNMVSYSTKLRKERGLLNRLFVPTSEDYVRGALKTFGRCRITTGYVGHSIQMFFMDFLPAPLFAKGFVLLAGLRFLHRTVRRVVDNTYGKPWPVAVADLRALT